MLLALSILIPLVTGLCISVSLIIREGRWSEWTLALFLAPGIGIAISSVLYFFWIIIFQPFYHLPLYLAVEAGLLCIIAAVVGVKFRKQIRLPQAPFWKGCLAPRRWKLITWVSVGGGLLLFVSLANFIEDWFLAFFAAPDGNWDAWSIWNLHARFINSGALWRTGFTPAVSWWSHPDYPLLLPSFIARVWALISSQSQYVPALVELCFLLCILGMAVSSVALLRGWKLAVFAGLFMIPILHDSLGTQQYADMALAFFFLAASLLLWLTDGSRRNQPGLLFLAGMMVGAAIWTKNEGWALLLAVALLEVLKIRLERPKFSGLILRWMWFALGILPMLAAVLVFKLQVAPPNDVIAALSPQDILAKITDLSRYTLIWQSVKERFFVLGDLKVGLLPALIAFVLLVGWKKIQSEHLGTLWIGLRLAMIALVYFGIYLLTPHPLAWHLTTSMSRLFDQLVPTAILMAFLFMKDLDDEPQPAR